MAKSIEPEVKDWFAQALSQHKTKYCIEQGTLNIEIENALKAAPSKSGGNGYGRPDFQLMLTPPTIEIVGFLGGAARFIAKPCLKQRVMRFPIIRYRRSA